MLFNRNNEADAGSPKILQAVSYYILMATTTAKTLAIDLEKALRLQNVVESGNFSITKRL